MFSYINRHFYKIVSAAFAAALILALVTHTIWPGSDDVFIFFPEDEQISFRQAKTEVDLLKKEDNDEYTLSWIFSSETDSPASLRKDMSLLFENGILTALAKQSVKDQLFIEEGELIKGEDSGRYDAVTFHYAENHYPEDTYRSKHTWSADSVYVVDSPLTPLYAFKEPATEQEKENKKVLDTIIDQQLDFTFDRLTDEYQLERDNYEVFTLLDMPRFEHIPLPGQTKKETFATLGRMWEGFYRYYVLGINTFTDESYSPEGNSLPFILLHKDGTHLVILYETKDGTSQQLIQMIEKES